MFGLSASAFSVRCLAGIVLLALAACSDSDIKLPKLYGDEIPPEVLHAPRKVPVPAKTAAQSEWPLLGAVPARPKDFTPQPVIKAAVGEMQNDRDDGLQLQQNYESAPPVAPTSP